MQPNDECYLICTKWFVDWINYVSYESTHQNNKDIKRIIQKPKYISNNLLINKSKMKLKQDKLIKKDFRIVSKDIWNFLYRLYGCKYVLYFYGIITVITY